MKKYLLFLLIVLSISTLSAQIKLNYETHALKANTENDMILTHYVGPGNGGTNVTWDFSNLQKAKDFKGELNETYTLKSASAFDKANTELREFNYNFYFDVNKEQILDYGSSNTDNTFKIVYKVPSVKMVFPFEYDQLESGYFSGVLETNSHSAQINGNYEILADGYGTLILPNVTVENTLRVRSTKTYTRAYEKYDTEVSIVTYRWYNAYERFPLLVLSEITVNTNGQINKSYQAAYKNEVKTEATNINSIEEQNIELTLYPNPTNGVFSIQFNAPTNEKYLVALYDLSGKLVNILAEQMFQKGANELQFNTDEYELVQGNYLIKIQSDTYAGKQILVIK